MPKTLIICMGLLLVSLSLAACGNTFHGAGRDIENMGEWVQDTF